MIPIRRISFVILFSVIFIAAAAFRLQRLSHRPMHTDEAVHAVKFGTLLETGQYRYDPADYHGPILNYATLIPAWIRNQKTFVDLDEKTMRAVPVLFGLGLMLLLPLLVRGLGRYSVLAAAFWMAGSAPLVFYSRYYIQEILLVFFSFSTFVCVYRYSLKPGAGWAAGGGLSAGLMYASKEASVLVLFAILGSFLISNFQYQKRNPSGTNGGKKTNRSEMFLHLLLAAAVMGFVSVLLYSSFLTYPKGFADSIRSFSVFFSRTVVHPVHFRPWYYYIQLLLYWHVPEKSVWSELPVVVLAFVGAFSVFRKRNSPYQDVVLIRFILYYTIILAVMYSLVPYKTPWNLLGFYLGLILLAGAGTAVFLQNLKSIRIWKWLLAVFMILVFINVRQSILLNGKFDSDSGNPWVYAQTSRDVLRIEQTMENIAHTNPEKYFTSIDIVVPRHEYWPLPWYLRRFKRIGWYDRVEETSPAASIILVTPQEESSLIRKLYERPLPGQIHLYLPIWGEYTKLRPGVELNGYARKEIWDLLQPEKSAQSTD